VSYIKTSEKILLKYSKNTNLNLKLILNNELKSSTNNNAKITNTVYGVVRREKTLNFIISELSNIRINKIEYDTLILIRIGLFLILFSDNTPDYAIVNEIVKNTKKRAKNFVNAILRNGIRKNGELLKKLENTNFSIKYSISSELIDNLKHLSSETENILKYLNKKPIFHILKNKDIKKNNSNSFLSLLKQITPLNTYQILKPDTIIDSVIKNGNYYIQNTGSQIISIIASIYAEKSVLDTCAAPGTKTKTLNNIKPDLNILANDISFNRLRLIDIENTKNICLTVSDLTHNSFKNRFDFIMVDAPCTSSGTLRKNPDLKTKITQDTINKNSSIQYKIMTSIMKELNPKYILYAVCSFIKAETDDVIDRLKNFEFETIDIKKILNKYNFKYKRGKNGFYLLPDSELNNDLFYLSLLKR